MSRPLIVLRPEPGNSKTTARARAAGIETHAVPLFDIQPVRWIADTPPAYVGVMFTSANAARMAGPALGRYLHLPAFAVGEATAAAVRDAGFASVVTGEGDVARLIAQIATLGLHRLLHLSGEDVTAFDPLGIEIDRRVVYSAVAINRLPMLDTLLMHRPVALLHSARAAGRFEQVASRARAQIAIVCISPQVAAAAGEGWEEVAVASEPRDEAMIDIAARLCGQDQTDAGK